MTAKKTKRAKIYRGSNIASIVQDYPKAAEALMTKYGLHCIGCAMASFEDLEAGAQAHGMSESDIDKMIEHLNKIADGKKT